MPISEDALREKFEKLNIWEQGGQRAPHKPLLLLLALGQLTRGVEVLEFRSIEGPLTELLREFGPSRSSYHPEYPFWRLQNDGIWVITASRGMRHRQSNSDPPKSELREANASGGFSEDICRALTANPMFASELAQRLLSAHFPETLHQDILDAVGLDGAFAANVRVRRDPLFRGQVLAAYGYKCAVCELDLRLGNLTIGLEAAHVRWHQARGPDSVENGIALCSLHHKVFDLGAFTIAPDFRLLVSEKVHGTGQLEHVLLRHHGQTIGQPADPNHRPHAQYLAWHRREVFKEGVRYLDER